MLRYTNSSTVIPAKAGIQIEKTGFRVKPGMTIKGKGIVTASQVHLEFHDRVPGVMPLPRRAGNTGIVPVTL